MSAIEIPDVAEKVAQARQQMAHDGCLLPSWDDLTPHEQKIATIEAGNWLKAVGGAGLTVVALPEPDSWTECVGKDGKDARTPYWRTSWGESVTAWIEGVEVPIWALSEDLEAIESDALKILAAVAACRRFRDEHKACTS